MTRVGTFMRTAFAAAFAFVLTVAGTADGQTSMGGTTGDGTKFKMGSGPTHSQQSAKSARKRLEKRLKMYLRLAEDLIKKEQYDRAISNLRAAIRVPLNDPGRRQAYIQLKALNDKAEDAFEDARNLYIAEQYIAARKKAAHTATWFRGLDAAKKAYRLLKKIDSDPKAVGAINEEKAKRLYAMAQRVRDRLEKDPDAIVDLHDRLRVLTGRRFAETPSGKTARAELAEMQRDPAVMKRIATIRAKREAASKMALARTYLRSGLFDKALKLMDEVIAADPTGEAARTAAALKKTPGG